MLGSGIGANDSLLHSILFEAKIKEPESAIPLLLVGLGGTGARVMQRVKWRAKWLGMDNLVRFLIVDTDRDTKTGEKGFPGFEDHEFVYLQSQPGRIILNNPDLHPDIKSRFDLDNPDILHQMRNFVEAGHDGAGQVPRNATLKFHGSFGLFKNRLTEAITFLNRRWADVKRQDVGNLRSFNTVLVSSVCGGTGAGILLDVSCVLENVLRDHESHLIGIFTLPDVYDAKVKGKKDDRERTRANTYGTLRELEYFRSGKAYQDSVKLSRQIQTPAKDMFSSVSVVSRIDASGQDLGNDEAVFDTIALYLGAFVGQTLQRRTLADLCNDNPLDLDPRLKRHRNIGTISATALSLPIVDLLGFCAYQQALDLVNDYVLGQEPLSDALAKDVDQWLMTNELEERASQHSDLIIERLRQATAFDASQATNRLYASASGKIVTYRSDREFVRAFDSEAQNWQQKERPKLVERLAEQVDPLVERAAKLLNEHVESLLANTGLRAAVAFLGRLSMVLTATSQELETETTNDKIQAKKFLDSAKTAIKPLTTFFGQMGTDKARQDRVILDLRNAVHLDGLSEVKRAAQRVVKALTSRSNKMVTILAETVDSWQKVRSHLEALSTERRLHVGRIPFGESQAELSALTPKLADAIYAQHRIGREMFREAIKATANMDYAEWVHKAGAMKSASETIILLAGRNYLTHILQLDIATLLEEESKAQNDEDKVIRKHLEAALTSCTALWRARLGQADIRFEDGLAVGRPAGADTAFSEVVEACNSRVSSDPAYQSHINEVQTNDRMRIYAIRRVAGGLPYYLESWDEYRSAYLSWQEKTGENCVHTLPQSVAANFPIMEPVVGVTEGERAFAIGLAFGWIARRGKFYYFNLCKNEAGQFVVPINSHFDCIAFEGKMLRDNPGTLKTMIENNLMKFESRNPTARSPKLGGDKGGRPLAERDFAYNPSAIELICTAYDQLCVNAGNDAVARDLESYLNCLKQNTVKTEPEAQEREISVIEQEIHALKPSARR